MKQAFGLMRGGRSCTVTDCEMYFLLRPICPLLHCAGQLWRGAVPSERNEARLAMRGSQRERAIVLLTHQVRIQQGFIIIQAKAIAQSAALIPLITVLPLCPFHKCGIVQRIVYPKGKGAITAPQVTF